MLKSFDSVWVRRVKILFYCNNDPPVLSKLWPPVPQDMTRGWECFSQPGLKHLIAC
uniref:Uncharacterized protein n=1 Tax=Anguilla anguilla TaxID=7936 RepID=A0A0E9P9G5_ANGAN